MLKGPENWNQVKIAKVLGSNTTRTVQIKEQPNIHLLYWTAWTNPNNLVEFRNDIYDRDKPLIDQLGKNSPEELT